MGPDMTTTVDTAFGAVRRDRGVALRGLWQLTQTASFGNAVIILFFLAQALDGGLTYVGVRIFGPQVEANPLLAWLMQVAGEGPALAGAKLAAAGFGIILHLASVHRALAILTALYLSAAVFPWMGLLILAGHLW
jgi:hypothetical protein